MRSGIQYVILAAFVWGIGRFLSKIAVTNADPFSIAVIRSMTFLPVVAFYVISQNDVQIKINHPLYYGMAAGVLVGIGIVTFRFALKLYDVSVVDPLMRLNPLITVIAGVWLLDEHITTRKTLGICAAFMALYLLLGTI